VRGRRGERRRLREIIREDTIRQDNSLSAQKEIAAPLGYEGEVGSQPRPKHRAGASLPRLAPFLYCFAGSQHARR